MAKKDDEKDDPKPWTPADPMEDEDDEKEVQRHARAEARKAHLIEQLSKPAKDKKKPGGLFS